MIDLAKTSRAKCRSCRQPIEKGALRFGELDYSFSESGSYRWYHLPCAARSVHRAVETFLVTATDLPVSKEEIHEAMLGRSVGGAPAASSRVEAEPPVGLSDLCGKAPSKAPAWLTPVPRPKTPDGKPLSEAAALHLVGVLKDGPSTSDLLGFRAWLGDREVSTFLSVLLELWDQRGTMRDKWVFEAFAQGGDAIVPVLGGALDRWMRAGASQKARVQAGLGSLVAIGSDPALLQIQGLSQRFAYKGYRNYPLTSLTTVARQRGMSLAELEDRLVPDGGLDANGARVFDFGSRQFTLTFDEEFQVRVRDDEGKVSPGLPRSRATDDAQKVETAKADWALLKTQLGTLMSVQRVRLEDAMATGRRWPMEPWNTLVRRHPLMGHLARRVVWGEYDDGQLVGTFRVDAEDMLLTVEEDPFEPQGGQLGLPHPAELGASLTGQWGDLFNDYQQFMAFPQLTRPVFDVRASDSSHAFSGFDVDGPIEPGRLHGVLMRRLWLKGEVEGDARVHRFDKEFAGHGLTATIVFHPGMWAGGDDEPQTVESIQFRIGRVPVELRNVPVVVWSEVMAVVERLVGVAGL